MTQKEFMKMLRKNADLTQLKSATLLYITPTTWIKYENGMRKPPLGFVELYCIKTNQNFEQIKNDFGEYFKSNYKKDF